MTVGRPRRRWLGLFALLLAGLGAVVAGAAVHAWRRALRPVVLEGQRPTTAFAWEPAGGWLALGGDDGSIEVWSSAGVPLARLAAPARSAGPVRALAFSPSGDRLGVVRGGALLVHAVSRGAGGVPILSDGAVTLCSREDELTSVAFSPVAAEVVAGSHHRARIYALATQAVRLAIAHPTYVQGVAFSPDGSLLATAGNDGVRLFDAADGKLRSALHKGGVAMSVAFSRDGVLVAAACDAAGLIWRAQAPGQPPIRIRGGAAISFSRDGARVVTTGRQPGRSPTIWRTADGSSAGAFGEEGAGPALFSPVDGRAAVLSPRGLEVYPRWAVPR